MAVCSCTSTDLFNTGTPGCQPLPSVIKRIILYPTTDSSGNINRIDLTAIPNNADILALINNDLAMKRLFPVAKSMVNVTNERGDTITEEFPDGSVFKIRQGVKTFHGEFVKQGATFANELDKVECVDMSAFLVDGNGSLIGDKSVAGFLTPIKIKNGTWDAKTVDQTDTTIAKVTLDFQWADSVRDGDIGFLKDSDFLPDVNWLTYTGLVALYGSAPSVNAVAGFTMAITNLYGSVTGQPATGLVKDDFDCNELDPTPATAPFITVTESPTLPGTYAFVWASAQDIGDKMELSIASTTFGFYDANLKSQTWIVV